MPINLQPEDGVPLPTGLPDSLRTSISYEKQFERVSAAVGALNKLIEMGATISEEGVPDAEIDLSDGLESGRAVEAFTGTAPLTPKDYSRAGVVLRLHQLLKDYNKNVVQSADQLRVYVTNKLLEESSEAEKAGDRIRALELIGKMQAVGLFAERHETTIKHGTTEELAEVLKQRLKRLIDLDKNEYETVVETN